MPTTYSLLRQTEGHQPELVAQYTDQRDALAALRDMTVDDLGDIGHDDVLGAGNETVEPGSALLWVEADSDGPTTPEWFD